MAFEKNTKVCAEINFFGVRYNKTGLAHVYIIVNARKIIAILLVTLSVNLLWATHSYMPSRAHEQMEV